MGREVHRLEDGSIAPKITVDPPLSSIIYMIMANTEIQLTNLKEMAHEGN